MEEGSNFIFFDIELVSFASEFPRKRKSEIERERDHTERYSL